MALTEMTEILRSGDETNPAPMAANAEVQVREPGAKMEQHYYCSSALEEGLL
jgi:hypothetical protein